MAQPIVMHYVVVCTAVVPAARDDKEYRVRCAFGTIHFGGTMIHRGAVPGERDSWSGDNVGGTS
jgi:hypothetical protein